MKIYLSGQRGFDNRGCEAIIRSTVTAFRLQSPQVQFLCPSDHSSRDSLQWPKADQFGLKFTPSHPPGKVLTQLWTRGIDKLPLAAALVSKMPVSIELKQDIDECDAVLSTGGDIYSLDYRAPARIASIDGYALKQRKPTFLWCASVGPFTKSPQVEKALLAQLSQFQALMVREDRTFEYLKGHGLKNVVRTSDPAFHLQPTPPTSFVLPASDGTTLGLNLSPIVVKGAWHEKQRLFASLSEFLQTVLTDRDRLVLISHVSPLSGLGKNDDSIVNEEFKEYLKQEAKIRFEICVAPKNLNAAELKFVISQLDFLVAARTHATIAAFSTGVPTISLAYSVKAFGLNREVYGHERYVLDGNNIRAASLLKVYNEISSQKASIKAQLLESSNEQRKKVNNAVSQVLDVLARDGV